MQSKTSKNLLKNNLIAFPVLKLNLARLIAGQRLIPAHTVGCYVPEEDTATLLVMMIVNSSGWSKKYNHAAFQSKDLYDELLILKALWADRFCHWCSSKALMVNGLLSVSAADVITRKQIGAEAKRQVFGKVEQICLQVQQIVYNCRQRSR